MSHFGCTRAYHIFAMLTVSLVSISFLGSSKSPTHASPTDVSPAPFLRPPYYGIVQVNSVYDHQYPIYDSEPGSVNSTVIHYDGTSWQGTVSSCTIGTPSCYSGHNGIDYDLEYELVRASAPGDVAYAGWRYPANHQAGEGLYVRVHHSNGYHTIYGHMSVLRVRTDEGICEGGEFSCILGISGSTGSSTGPHLHFELEPPGSDYSVNPYGWIGGAGNDPWENETRAHPEKYGFPHISYDLWSHYPSITNGDVYPSGAPLTTPLLNENEPGAFIVDDGSADFVESPAGCWTVDTTLGWSGDYRHRDVPDGDCTAKWNFPSNQPAGRYHVFAHIPNDNVPLNDRDVTVDAARYTISHTVSLPSVGQD